MKKRVLALILLALMLLPMAACGNDEENQGNENDQNDEKQSITIAIGNSYQPFCYLNENEEPDGYENDLFELVAEKLSDKYNVKIVCESWDNIFVGLESGKYDLISHHLA